MKFIVVCGTEKAGTTSLFNYFYNHPAIIPSLKKETNYFRDSTTISLDHYLKQFYSSEGGVYFEASPGYLAASEIVVSRIASTLSDCSVKLIFVLRDPVDRIISSFKFHKSRGYIDSDVLFSQYIDAAINYKKDLTVPSGISEWALQSVFHGEYDEHVSRYIKQFESRVMILSYDDFSRDPKETVKEICNFTGIDTGYFEGYKFFVANRTFSPKYAAIHNLLLKVNRALSPVFFRYPKMKDKLLAVYKFVNKSKDDELITGEDIDRMIDIYRPSVRGLVSNLSSSGYKIPEWAQRYC